MIVLRRYFINAFATRLPSLRRRLAICARWCVSAARQYRDAMDRGFNPKSRNQSVGKQMFFVRSLKMAVSMR